MLRQTGGKPTETWKNLKKNRSTWGKDVELGHIFCRWFTFWVLWLHNGTSRGRHNGNEIKPKVDKSREHIFTWTINMNKKCQAVYMRRTLLQKNLEGGGRQESLGITSRKLGKDCQIPKAYQILLGIPRILPTSDLWIADLQDFSQIYLDFRFV